MDLSLCLIFTQRPLNDSKIELSSEHCFCLYLVPVKSIDIIFSHIKKVLLSVTCSEWFATVCSEWFPTRDLDTTGCCMNERLAIMIVRDCEAVGLWHLSRGKRFQFQRVLYHYLAF